MKRALYLLASLTMVSAAAFAQTKKSFTLEDLLPGGKNFYNLLPQNNHGLTWWNNRLMDCDVDDIKTIDPKDGKETIFITVDEVNRI